MNQTPGPAPKPSWLRAAEDGAQPAPSPSQIEGFDPDATQVAPRPAPAGAPGAVIAPDGDFLPIGYRLMEFEVLARLGQGGFSIVYKVWDHLLKCERALKEYMPSSMATRRADCAVVMRSERHQEVFEACMRGFIDEAQMLVRFDHPALVRVYRYFEANGTAYMVMQLAEGRTLKSVAEDDFTAKPPSERWLLDLLDPLTDVLAVVHKQGIAHRDIAPDNIVLLKETGRPLLLDFGAARAVISGDLDSPTEMVKPNYAPIEQFLATGLKQGAFTDVYALCAVVHRLLVGKPPPQSQNRRQKDTYEPLAVKLAGKYSPGFLKAIDRGLVLLPDKRTRDIAALRRDLGLGASADQAASRMQRPSKGSPVAGSAAWWAGGAAALIVMAVGLVWWVNTPSGLAGRTDDVAEAAPRQPLAPPTPAPETAAPPLTPVAEPLLPLDAEGALRSVLAGSRGDATLSVRLVQSRLKKNETPLEIGLRSSVGGYVYLLVHDTDREVRLIYPSEGGEDNRIEAGRDEVLPRAMRDPLTGLEALEVITWSTPGSVKLLAIVSDAPLDYRAAMVEPTEQFPVLRTGAAAESTQRAQPRRPFLAGSVSCNTGEACSQAWLAGDVTFEVIP